MFSFICIHTLYHQQWIRVFQLSGSSTLVEVCSGFHIHRQSDILYLLQRSSSTFPPQLSNLLFFRKEVHFQALNSVSFFYLLHFDALLLMLYLLFLNLFFSLHIVTFFFILLKLISQCANLLNSLLLLY